LNNKLSEYECTINLRRPIRAKHVKKRKVKGKAIPVTGCGGP
jgi:hypothetical protein